VTKTANGKPNRSDAIREHLAANPKAGSKEVIAALAAKGVKVSSTLVYYVKSKQGQANLRAKREVVAEQTRKSGVANPVELVIRLKDLAGEVGGMANLKRLVDLLAD